MTRLALVIISYNDKEFLPKLFSSIKAQKAPLQRIVFVDNCSPDSPEKAVKSVKGLLVEFIRTKRNLLFAAGTNVGIRRALNLDAEILGIINSDIYFEKGCFKKILEFMEKNPDVAAVQPRLYKMGTNSLTSPPLLAGIKGFIERGGSGDSPTDSVSGAALFVRANALKKSGLFYEPFYHTSEDSYLTYCLQKIGRTVWLYDAVGYHRVGIDSEERAGPAYSLFRRLKTRNSYILALKTAQRRPGWLAWSFLDFFKELAFFIIGYKNRSVRLDYIKGYLWGFKETFFHLFNNSTYLEKGIDYKSVPSL